MRRVVGLVLTAVLIMLAIPVLAQNSDIRIADFGVRGGNGDIPYPFSFSVDGKGPTYMKGEAVRAVIPNLIFFLVGSVESDDQIICTFYNSAGGKLGVHQEGVGGNGGPNIWMHKFINCDPVKLPKVGNYSVDITLVNKATGRNLMLRKAKFSVEEIVSSNGEQHLVVCQDCHLREGWLWQTSEQLIVVFYVKCKGVELIPKVRLYCNGQQVGEVLDADAASSQNLAAQGLICFTHIKYADMLAKDGDWEARVAISGEPARVLKWKVENGALGYHPEQCADKTVPGRLFADSRFVEVEVLKCPVEAKWNPELIKWPNMFFGRKPISQ